jgi:large-conductance mechanosensitive channel
MRYSAEKTRFHEELAAANVKVDHQKAVDAAAANVLATTGTPGAEAASAAYTALTKDANAQTTMYNSQAQAKIDKFLSDYQFLRNQSHQQQMTLDLVITVKDKLFTVKDDMEYSVGTFGKQISEIRNQININKATHQQATDYGKWIGTGLNFAIVLALLFMIFVIGRKAMGGASFSPPAGPLGAPARPPASEHTVELLKGLTGLLSASPK